MDKEHPWALYVKGRFICLWVLRRAYWFRFLIYIQKSSDLYQTLVKKTNTPVPSIVRGRLAYNLSFYLANSWSLVPVDLIKLRGGRTPPGWIYWMRSTGLGVRSDAGKPLQDNPFLSIIRQEAVKTYKDHCWRDQKENLDSHIINKELCNELDLSSLVFFRGDEVDGDRS